MIKLKNTYLTLTEEGKAVTSRAEPVSLVCVPTGPAVLLVGVTWALKCLGVMSRVYGLKLSRGMSFPSF